MSAGLSELLSGRSGEKKGEERGRERGRGIKVCDDFCCQICLSTSIINHVALIIHADNMNNML